MIVPLEQKNQLLVRSNAKETASVKDKDLAIVLQKKDEQIARYKKLLQDDSDLATFEIAKKGPLKDIIIAIIGALATISAAIIGYAAAKKR
ncbi:MAG: hypothetical protein GXO75_18800 [Calditrichaeota bacterium]|nr:hypothetical protein [Calditrichota bacterium]